MALACRVMRQVLVQHARYHGAQKRANGHFAETLDENALDSQSGNVDILVLNEALERLEAIDKRMVQVVECRYLGGLSTRETAEALDLSSRTVERFWTRAKIYLYQALRGDQEQRQSELAGAC